MRQPLEVGSITTGSIPFPLIAMHSDPRRTTRLSMPQGNIPTDVSTGFRNAMSDGSLDNQHGLRNQHRFLVLDERNPFQRWATPNFPGCKRTRKTLSSGFLIGSGFLIAF